MMIPFYQRPLPLTSCGELEGALHSQHSDENEFQNLSKIQELILHPTTPNQNFLGLSTTTVLPLQLSVYSSVPG